jgi:hypothetical protein
MTTKSVSGSINSIDDMLALDVPEDASESWKQELTDRMEEIIDRKRSSAQGREVTLAQYVHILMSHYALEEIRHKSSELFPAFLKSIKAENSEKETCLALRGLFTSSPWKTCSNYYAQQSHSHSLRFPRRRSTTRYSRH